MRKLSILLFVFHQFLSNAQDFLMVRALHENDLFTPFGSFNNKDENYTGGAKLELIGHVGNMENVQLLNLLDGTVNYVSLFFNETVFTPQHLEYNYVDQNDRPYASYTSFGFGNVTFSASNLSRLSYELHFGKMGLPIAGNAQTYIHENHFLGSTRPVPQGWGFEIADGGAFAFNGNVKYEYMFFGNLPNDFDILRISATSEINLGQYMTNAALGARLQLLNYNLNANDINAPSIVALAGAANGFLNNVSFQLFAQPRVRFVALNSTLSGKGVNKQSAYVLSNSEINRTLIEGEAGFLAKIYCFKFGYTCNFRSREFSKQQKKIHSWGGIFIGVGGWF